MRRYSGAAGTFSSGLSAAEEAPARLATEKTKAGQLSLCMVKIVARRTELPIPSSSKFPYHIAFGIVNVTLQFTSITSSPASGLESQDTFFSSSVVCNFHISIMIDLRVAHNEIRYARRYFLPAVMLADISCSLGWLVVVRAPFLRQDEVCMRDSGGTDLE